MLDDPPNQLSPLVYFNMLFRESFNETREGKVFDFVGIFIRAKLAKLLEDVIQMGSLLTYSSFTEMALNEG